MENLTNSQIKKQIKSLKKEKHSLILNYIVSEIDEFMEGPGIFSLLCLPFIFIGGLLFNLLLEIIVMIISIVSLILVTIYIVNNVFNIEYKGKKNEINNKIKELKSKMNNYEIENENTINKVRGHKRIKKEIRKDEKQELLELRNHVINMEDLNSKEEAKAPYTLK